MKYINFKRYKFSTIFKNINLRRYKLITFAKNVDFKRYNFSKIYRYFNFKRYNFSGIFRYFNFKRYNFSGIFRYFNPKRYKLSNIFKYFDLKNYKFFSLYIVCFISFLFFIYLIIPTFFNYDKLKIQNVVCKDFNFKCSIQGEIKYSFLPSPRIKFDNFVISDLSDKNKVLANIEKIYIKISISNLFDKEKFNFTSINLKKAEINLNLEKFEDYKNFYYKKINFKPINLSRGKINFFDNKKYITNITNIKFKHRISKKVDTSILKGLFLNDKIYIKLQNKKDRKKISNIITLKALNSKLYAKINIFNQASKKDLISGNILLKNDKNRLTAFFDYGDDKIVFKQSNLKTFFSEGKFNGEVNFSPYFNFDVNVDLSAINFNKLSNLIINLNEKRKKELFRINKKINGKLTLSTNKIYSKYNLVKSFESRIKFINGNISIEQFLINLGKLGAADIVGHIKNDEKFTNFKFEKNIFIDNKKHFYSKFGIYNKKNISSNLFILGNIDLINLNMSFYEISGEDNNKFTNEDINYIEKEFNDILFEEGYKSFFNYKKLKEYIKLIMSEED